MATKTEERPTKSVQGKEEAQHTLKDQAKRKRDEENETESPNKRQKTKRERNHKKQAKKKLKKKKKVLEEHPPVVVDEGERKTAALTYLKQWKEDRESWKFHKNNQFWLVEHIFDQEKVHLPFFHSN